MGDAYADLIADRTLLLIQVYAQSVAAVPTIGDAIRFEDVSPAKFGEMLTGVLPPWQVEGLLEDYAHYARGGADERRDKATAPPRQRQSPIRNVF